ncbi:Hsp70 family protein [Butyrivibrio sp. VCD2006]|uniref:Hsp70 family protein n=1 Tax=Butyrivibrio sp. VCD2006 TaxID=1280664 RepID=UPI000401FBE4|nr:Hsp70 family protein [Butyrivibrio sp. VCD2006]
MAGKKFKWIGIDFGTTNSAAISFLDEGNSIGRYEHGDDQGTPFPSIVGINKTTGEVITGRDAKNRRMELSENYEFFTSIKTIIDKDEYYDVAGKKWTPVALATEILKGLKEEILRKNVDAESVVMAVPVGFSPLKKRKLREAAQNAGISIETFISEPTAALVSNYAKMRMFRNVAVFDWGGGTLDVAILHIEDGRVEEVTTSGMNLAGDNIDRKIAEQMHIKYCLSKNVSKSFDQVDAKSKDRLIVKSEAAKIDLSEGEEVARIMVPNYDGAGVFMESIEYEFFDQLVEPEVNEAIHCINVAIEKAHLNKANIDAVLCVGGSSRLKPFREKVTEIFGEEKVIYPEKVMWNIAEGAAIVSMSNTAGGYGMNQDIGLILSNGTFYPLLKKGQRIPCKEKRINFASVTDEESIRFLVTDAEDPTKRTFEEPIVIERKGQGFMSEQFEVSCFVDPDLLLRFRVRSTLFMKQYLYMWTYNKLNIYYQIEGGAIGTE